jgi:biotin carboxyl carrier protein
MALTHADVRRLLDILTHASHFDSLDVTLGEFVLRARKHDALEPAMPLPDAGAGVAAAVAPAGCAAARESAAGEDVPPRMLAVRAPLAGTFYRRPKPEQPPFVEVGSRVEAGAPIALLETMKLFNTVAAPAAGRIASIAAQDSAVVQRDALLMTIEPDSQP